MGVNFSDKSKGISTLISAMINTITVGLTSAIPMFGVYFISYYKYMNPSLTLHYSFFYSPISTIGNTLIGPFGGYVEHILGPRFNILLCVLLKYYFLIALYQSKSVWMSYLYTLFFGIAGGFGNAVLSKHCCFYFPEKKGLINSIIAAAGIIVIAGTNLFGEDIINPYKEQLLPEINCYPPEVSQNISILIKLFLYIIPISALLSILLVFPYKKKEDNVYMDIIKDGPEPNEPILRDSISEDINKEEDKENNSERISTQSNNSSSFQRNKSTYKKDLKKALKSKRLWVLVGVSFFSNFLPLLSSNTYKTIASLNHFNQQLIVVFTTLVGIMNLIATPIWGFLSDKIKFKNIITTLNAGIVITGIIMCLFISQPIIYSVCFLTQIVLFCGIMLTVIPYIMKIFSIQYSLELGGIVRLSTGLSNVIGSIVSFIITQIVKIDDPKYKNIPYIIFFGIGIIFNGISIILVRKAKENEFNYDEQSIIDIEPPNENEEEILK